MAFIIAGIVFLISLGIFLFIYIASMMSDSPSASADASSTATSVLIGGTIVAVLIASTHYLPHFGW